MSDETPKKIVRYKPKPRPKPRPQLPIPGQDVLKGSRVSRMNPLVGAKIAHLRSLQNLTQKQLGQALTESSGLLFPLNLISRLERGMQSPLPDEVVAICRYFGLDYEWFLSSDSLDAEEPKMIGQPQGDGRLTSKDELRAYAESIALMKRMSPEEAVRRLLDLPR